MKSIRFAVLLTGLAIIPLWGQSTSTATLRGVVTDPSDAVIPGVAVTLKNPDTEFSRRLLTGPDGAYRADLLPPGTYQIRFEMGGFAPYSARQTLTVGAAVDLDVKLLVGASDINYTVVEETPALEPARSQQSNTIDQHAIAELPIDRRDYLSFSLLAPGVSDSKAHADSNTYRVKQTPDSGLSFYGSNGRGNTINVDGGESNDGGGGVRTTVGQEAVREFQVNRSNYTAEYGGSRGGVVNIVTKGGTNNLHGSAFGFFRHQGLDATNPFNLVLNQTSNVVTRVKPESQRQQFGATLGGPVVKDKTFFFLDYEQLRKRESGAVPILTDLSVFGPTPAQKAILSQLPASAAAQLTAALSTPASVQQMFLQNSGIFPFQADQHQGLIRLDHQMNQNNQFSARFNTSRGFETNPNVSALTGISRGFVSDVFDTVGTLNWFHVFNPRLINEAHAQFDYYDLVTDSNEKFGPALEISGFGNFNRDRFLPSDSISRRSEFFDNLTWTHGRNTMKAGAYVLIRNEHTDSATFMSGRFTFGALPGGLVNAALASTTINSLQAFNLGLAQSYQQGFGNGVVSATYPLYAGFIHDEWRATNKLTLNLGLRYEVDNRRAPLPTDHKKLAPRFGFAFSPDSKTVIRGGYGIYYSAIDFQIDYSVYALGVTPSGFRPIAQVLTTIQTPGAQSAANIFGTLRAKGVIGVPTPTRAITPADLTQFGINISQTGPLPPLSVIFKAAPGYRNPQTQQASLGVQRDFGNGLNVGVNGIFVRGAHLTDAYDDNLLSTAPFDKTIGTQNYAADATHPGGYFVNPLIFQSNLYESNSNSFYGALIVEGSKKFGRNLQVHANYTWSHATDETTDYNSDFEPNNQFCRRCDRSSSSFDERHKIVAYALLQTPAATNALFRNWVFSPIYQFHSGQPFNLLVGGTDLNNDRHNTTDRPAYAGRNTGLGPSFWTFDARFQRTIPLRDKMRLDLMFEAFNLFNKLNYQSVNNSVGAAFSGPFNVKGRTDRNPTDPLGFTSAFDPRRIQLGFRLTF